MSYMRVTGSSISRLRVMFCVLPGLCGAIEHNRSHSGGGCTEHAWCSNVFTRYMSGREPAAVLIITIINTSIILVTFVVSFLFYLSEFNYALAATPRAPTGLERPAQQEIYMLGVSTDNWV